MPSFNLTAWVEHEWYTQQQMPTVFQPKENLFCVRAYYDAVSPDELDVLLTDNEGGVTGPNNEPGSMGFTHKMIINDPVNAPSKMKLGAGFLPPSSYGDYWVLFAGPGGSSGYDYGVVSAGPPMNFGERDPNGNGTFFGCIAGNDRELNGAGLWLFTREPEPDREVVEMLRNKTIELGFDLSILEPVEHTGCTYPSI
jgi:lipocalin